MTNDHAAHLRETLAKACIAEQEAAEHLRDAIEAHEAAVHRRIRAMLRTHETPAGALQKLARLAGISTGASSPATQFILTVEAEAARKAMSEVQL